MSRALTAPRPRSPATAAPPASTAVCGRWTARFSYTLTAADTVSVVAISGTVRSSASSIPLRLNFASGVVPAILFSGTMARTLTIWKRSGAAGAFTNTGATITQGVITTFPLALCETPWLRVTEGDANDQNNLSYTDVPSFAGHPDAPPMQLPVEL